VGRTHSLPLSALKDTVLGIDASHYINQHLLNQSTREALLGALGGFPFALRANIEKELQIFKNLGVGCIFVFNGLEFGKREQRAHPETQRSFEAAWELYDQQQADRVVDAFSNAGMAPFNYLSSKNWRRGSRACTNSVRATWRASQSPLTQPVLQEPHPQRHFSSFCNAFCPRMASIFS
jgi:hypothetical protein